MAQTYKVNNVGSSNDWSNTHGKHFTSYRCGVEGLDGDVEVVKVQGNPAPAVGSEIFGRVEPKTQAGYTWRFFTESRPQSSNNGSSRSSNDGSYSPEVQARIDAVGRVKGRCHAQAVAAGVLGPQIAALINDPDALGPFLNGPYKRFVNWLVSDAETARNLPTEGN